MYGHVATSDLTKVEGIFPQVIIRTAVENLSKTKPAWAFRVFVQKSLGFDDAHPPSYEKQAEVYNKIADALNALGDEATDASLCEYLKIAAPEVKL